MATNSEKVAATVKRQSAAYAMLAQAAIAAGYMAHTRDTAGFEIMRAGVDAGTITITITVAAEDAGSV